MQFIGYSLGLKRMVGRLVGDHVSPLTTVDDFYADLPRWISMAAEAEAVLDLATLALQPAIPSSARVPCIGLNYKAHAAEGGMPIPDKPAVFGRYAASLAASGQDVPVIDPKTDWEGELAIVIGERLFRADEATAAEAIFGYAVFNDISARTYQFESTQWTMGKNGERSGVVGAIVTRDEAGDPSDGLRLRTWVNGQVMQDALTSEMIFNAAQIVAYLSKAMVLNPGDIIPTGTPSGVGLARNPQMFLQPGDVVEVEIDRLGRIHNTMITA